MTKRWPITELPRFHVAEAPRRFTDTEAYEIRLTVTPIRAGQRVDHDACMYGYQVSRLLAEDTRALPFIARQMIDETFRKFFGLEGA